MWPFENDVKGYGFQTGSTGAEGVCWFENDVKGYGFQTADLPVSDAK